MIDIASILKELKEKESTIELDLEDIKFGTDNMKLGLSGKVKLRFVHLTERKTKPK